MGKNLKKGQIILIEWTDSFSSSRWYTDNEIRAWIKDIEDEVLLSVGFFYKYSKKGIVIYGDKVGIEKARLHFVPKEAVRNIKKLK